MKEINKIGSCISSKAYSDFLEERSHILNSLRNNSISGKKASLKLAEAMDDFLINISFQIFGNENENFSILALGGYGRKELCPFSDIDLLFLVQEDMGEEKKKNLERLLYIVWDSGIKIGHAVRTQHECLDVALDDPKTFSNLLDARIIWGNFRFFTDMQDNVINGFSAKQRRLYTEAKLLERDNRHKRLGDTRYVLEPNVKEGKGGLRDYQTLFWITQVLYNLKTPSGLARASILTQQEKSKFRRAHDFLLTLRCHLHDLSGRAEERLHFDIQPKLAERLGYTNKDNAKAVERFMKHYFRVTRDIGDLTRIVCAAIEETEKKSQSEPLKDFKGFEITNGRLNFASDHNLEKTPLDIIRLFRIAQISDLDLHPSALRLISKNLSALTPSFCKNEKANALFLKILCDNNNAYLILRRMNEAGIIERFIPAFRKAIGLMQFDRYHVYTVDEHTLKAIRIAHSLENGDLKEESILASALIHLLKNRRVLYVALLLHDLCKGLGGSHEQLGAELALKLCPRLGLNDTETRLCSWLIFDHLFMSNTAFRRDLNDEKTLNDFLFRVHDMERLNLITVFTAIDIMAVGPGRYNAWKEGLLQDLYYKAEKALHGKAIDYETLDPIHTFKPPEDMPHIEISNDSDNNATSIHIIAPDSAGLFAKLAGALSASSVNILEARIHTLKDNFAYDIFKVQNTSAKALSEKRYKDIRKTILAVLNDELDPKGIIKKTADKQNAKALKPDIPCGMKRLKKASRKEFVIEIFGPDRIGLLYDLACLMRNHGFNIKSAKINTYGIKAIDVFYLEKNGATENALDALEQDVMQLMNNA